MLCYSKWRGTQPESPPEPASMLGKGGPFPVEQIDSPWTLCSCTGSRGSCHPQIIAFSSLALSFLPSDVLATAHHGFVILCPSISEHFCAFLLASTGGQPLFCLSVVSSSFHQSCVNHVSLCDGNGKSSSPCDYWVPWHCYSHKYLDWGRLEIHVGA